ncbi:unnamed protein product (macronuclear) [Paramecium tetraurelia]|uniref:MORN repeat protein n=1 Tax=Paramecium tetraurelia TaxID=5888 RepID=A0CE08_PARTE|nr:uncharacterized protein GSPATT00007237001 [Paramecium tetraurelia]CAK69025.1 unnamed protein product [Paramecium tetraurelia]|eukprot:XP_001436422.1 hypothetical protein (macronuclear) [Paramecium tetraurelia strain d4-2]
MGSKCSNCAQCQKDKLEQLNEVTITKKSESHKNVISSNSQLSQQNNAHLRKQKSNQSHDDTDKKVRALLLSKKAIVIQKYWKGYKSRKAYEQARMYLKKSQIEQATIESKSKRNTQKYFIQEDKKKLSLNLKKENFDQNTNLRVGRLMKESGWVIKETVKEFKFGWMEPSSQVNGRIIKPVDKEPFTISTVLLMKDNGRVIEQTDSEFTNSQMELFTQDNGKMIINMDKVRRNGLIIQCIRENISKARNKDKERISGQMEVTSKESGLIIRQMVMEFMFGLMERQYKGIWKDNKMHGYGVYQWTDGRSYHGEYLNDKKHGKGKYFWPDGKVFEGEWVDGKQNGRGKYLMPDGRVKFGWWEKGKRINLDGKFE